MTSKKKSPNFTVTEKEILLDMVDQFKYIIEDKRSDTQAIAKKNNAWVELSKRFCSQPNTYSRTAKQLKNFGKIFNFNILLL
mgnify:CR=1 FL=1